FAPSKILAFNRNLERHHLRLTTAITSGMFLRGVPLDRIHLRPSWLYPWKKSRTRTDRVQDACVVDGRPLDAGRRRVAVLMPYFPYPLSHGGAVRMYYLLREAASEFDIFLFAFALKPAEAEYGPVMEFCAKAVVMPAPYYREPRWSTLDPPEVAEYRSAAMEGLIERIRREYGIRVLQVEYTQMATYGGDILVEHDITSDLYRQVYEREPTIGARWNWYRWQRFERRAVRQFARVVAMSEKDAQWVARPEAARVIENGVDLDRFQPQPERDGRQLLFIGSFNHFPNIEAFRFFREQIWPLLPPEVTLTVVAGRDHAAYWRAFTGDASLPEDERIDVHDFVRDVKPMYAGANLVIVPTTVSAGTNLKVLEAMAMERAVVSTSCGCAGLGLEHGKSVWVADDAAGFAAGVIRLLGEAGERRRLAVAARAICERQFGWKDLGAKQRALFREVCD
ncbi:MAG: glycosyltransferase family 4 protein, partial [Bryobacteraceae bacterium]